MNRDSHDLANTEGDELILRPEAEPTASYDDDELYRQYIKKRAAEPGFAEPPTEPDVLGPYFRPSAPFRAKVTPPNEPGITLLILGRIWGYDTRRPLQGAVVDIWQADSDGHYDNEDPKNPPPANSFKNRVRLVTDEKGGLEYETVHPGAYKMDTTTWRSPHIHYRVRHAGYRTLVTQLFFRGDPYEDTDPFFKQSLAISLAPAQSYGKLFERGVFDIVLAHV